MHYCYSLKSSKTWSGKGGRLSSICFFPKWKMYHLLILA
uniref:Uncharacterized protein n=1 Tax=Rhizophora mucronata TaxID=61149 RepID=A0A2P2QJ64_RHIMU